MQQIIENMQHTVAKRKGGVRQRFMLNVVISLQFLKLHPFAQNKSLGF